MKKCLMTDCENMIEDKYYYCIGCNIKRKSNSFVSPTEKPASTPNKDNEVLKNINTALWRLVIYAEHELIKKGEDPKKILNDSWAKHKENDKTQQPANYF